MCPSPEPLDNLSLPLKRVFADEIIAGTKTVEYREYKEHYHKRLIDKNVVKWMVDNKALLTDDEYNSICFIRPVRKIHFYDYNGTWSLDVSIKETGMLSFSAADIKHQHELGSAECDEEFVYYQNRGIPVIRRDKYYYFAIDHVIDSSL